MDVGRRAKQFAPFAALRGLDETIRQQEIIYEPKRDLSEEKKNELDMKLRILAYGMKIQATYFQKPDGVIEINVYDRTMYLWYYDDLKSDKRGNNLSYSVDMPE